MKEVLTKFLNVFVTKDKQERYQSLLSSKKRRNDGVWDLLHDGRHLAKDRFHRLSLSAGGNASELGILKLLTDLKVRNVYILSCDDYDGNSMPIEAALAIYAGKQIDVILYDDTAKAGYYENHEGETYIFSDEFVNQPT